MRSWKLILSRRMIVNLLLGFSSGLPLLVTGSTLQAWMTDHHIDLKLISIFALAGFPYTLKFLWSPLMDRFVPPFLGRRRGWLLITQFLVAGTIAMLPFAHPELNPAMVAVLAVLIAFFSASQDIIVDAYRRESLAENELALGTSLYVFGYRMAILFSGAFALFLADRIPWSQVFWILSLGGLVGICATLMATEPVITGIPPRTLREAVIEPFREYFSRPGAWGLLGFILLYKLGDNIALSITTPFAMSIGFSKTDIAAIAKTFGMAATLGGGFLGGLIVLRIGVNRALWIFGYLQAIAILGFSGLSMIGHETWGLAAAIGFENLCTAMATVAYVAFIAGLTNRRFTATQYALLSSLTGIPRTLASAPAGYLVENLGWFNFYLLCTLIAVPGLVLLRKFAPLKSGSPGCHTPKSLDHNA